MQSCRVREIVGVVICCCFFILTASVVSATNPKHVFVLETMDVPIVKLFSRAFIEKLQQSERFQSGELTFNVENAGGDSGYATTLLHQEIDRNNPDVVVAVATLASVAAKKNLPDTPVVFMCVTDPIGAGLIQEIGKPTNSNITGKVHAVPAKTKVEIVMQVLSEKITTDKVLRFGYIHTDYPADIGDLARLQVVASERGDIEFVPYEIPYRPIKKFKNELLEDLEAGIREVEGQVDYFWAPRGALAVLPEHDMVFIEKTKKPLIIGATEESVKNGVLLHITADPYDQGIDTALLVEAVLQGAEVGQLPASYARKIQFAINLDVAVAMKLAIPSHLLQLAGENVYPK